MSFAMSGRFDATLRDLVEDAFPGGVVHDEGRKENNQAQPAA
ncbi:hypothetical protein ACFHW2_29525 [Actinomadura sp. LOL_016]